jgi:small-conductance mechanosensitive channel
LEGVTAGTDLVDVGFALAILVCCGLIALVASRAARRFATSRFTPAQAEVAGRLVFGTVVLLGIVSALRQVGLDLSIFVGAAGLLTVAVGFASQTSASNLISGLFLLFERPFSIRDVIRVGTTTGEVVSIDLLSVRLRTFDNLLVRVPNETLLKSEIINLSYFPLRRFDLQVVVDYDADLEAMSALLVDLANEDPMVMDEPSVVAHFVGFVDRGAQFQVSAWAARDDYLTVKNRLPPALHTGLRRRGVELPVPRQTLRIQQPKSTEENP